MRSILCHSCIALSCLILAGLCAHAQDKLAVKFGKVIPRDFTVNADALDSTAGAVIVADFGTAIGMVNSRGGLFVEFRRSTRIRILKRTGFDAATITIPFQTSGAVPERIDGLRASTYNLEDGKVVETDVDSKSIFMNKVSKGLTEEKFTFPSLKEGSIVEYSYTLTSPLTTNLQPWTFQGKYPCLWSEYQVDIPDAFKYVVLSQGYLPFTISTMDNNAHKTNYRWVIRNVPPLREEPYTTALSNYVAKVEFQLTGIQFPSGMYKDMLTKWTDISEQLLNSEEFGADLDSHNSWLDDDLKSITNGAVNDLDRAKKIYAYIRDSFTCVFHSSAVLSQPLRTVYRNRSGNDADLNLLLTAMLIHQKIGAEPVILSTRSHGFSNDVYPQLNRFNYVISRVTIDSSVYYLDASEPWLGFGRLPARCYNGNARVVSKEASSLVNLSADLMLEATKTVVFITNDEKGGLTAQLQSLPGYNEAAEVRQNVKEQGKQSFLKKLQTSYSDDVVVSDLELDSLRMPDWPLGVGYSLRLPFDTKADVYYFNPMLAEGFRENPFKAAERAYPVEMPYAVDKTYIMSMDIPAGYVVDELPKSAKVLLNTDEGYYEYIISKDDQQIQFRSRIQLVKANYQPEDYASLRDFFAFVVKKESEQIVFKKKK